MVKRMIMQMQDTAPANPVKNHSKIRWYRFLFMMRFSRAAMASFGMVKARMPNKKLRLLRRRTNSTFSSEMVARCCPKPLMMAVVVIPQKT